MKKSFFCLSLTLGLLSLGSLGAQNNSDRPLNPALPEGPEVLENNPAGLGFEAMAGLGGYLGYDQGKLTAGHVEILGRFMGYNYSWNPKGMSYTLGYGWGWNPQILSGGFSWTNKIGEEDPGTIKIGLASRPLSFLALGLTADLEEGGNILGRGGAALRPLAFSSALDRILTLDASARGSWDPDVPSKTPEVQWERLGATLRPVPGLSIAGIWNQPANTFTLEAGVQLETLRMTTSAPLASLNNLEFTTGRLGYWAGYRPRETIFRAVSPATVIAPVPLMISEWEPAGWFGIRGPNWRMVQDELLRLAEDSAVKTVVFDKPIQFASGALAWEFGKTLQVLKARGKKIHWYLEQPTLATYVMAAWTADEIVLPPAGSLILTGLGNQQLYWKDFLATWGIKFHNLRISPYKTAGDTLSESGRSAEDRERWAGILKEWEQVLAQALEEGRKDKLKDSASNLLAQGPFWDAKNAQELGLVDKVAYKDEFLESLGLGGPKLPLNTNTVAVYEKPYVDHWSAHSFKKIGLVWFSGDITEAEGNREFTPGMVSLAAALRSAGEDTSLDGIVLRMDSGGGAMLASDLIAREMDLIRKKNKPLFVSMAGAAASGGYYIAAPADRIFATPLTLTGSIGVISLIPDLTGLLEKQKIGSDLVATSPNAGLGNPFRPFTPEAEASFRSGVDGAYSLFLNHVSAKRNLPLDELKPLAGGRIWSAQGALEGKLIDQVGGLKETLDAMREKLGGGEIEIVDIATGSAGGLDQLLLGLSPKAQIPAPFDQAAEYYTRVQALGTGSPLYWMEDAP